MTRTRKITNQKTNHNDLADKLQILEQQLNQLEDQLVRAQRLAALGTMAMMIAHEFNNILTPVVSYAQYALNRSDTDLMRKALEKAFLNGKEAAEVCQQLLSFARGENSTKRSDVAQIIEATLKCLVRNPVKDNIELQVQTAENLAVPVEPCLLQQVLYNLIINARDAMLGRPGKLKITASAQDGQQAVIEVKDSGAGIDPAILSRIFDPFFTTKNKVPETTRNSGGSGLGLSVTKHILERAGGKIGVQSEPGRGTTFTITLPLAGEIS
jgi:signal transduction histidine kinase